MRHLAVAVVAMLAVVMFSRIAEPQQTESVNAPKSRFLSNLSVGEKIIIPQPVEDDGVAIHLVTAEKATKLMPTDEERRLYNEATKVLQEHQIREVNLEDLSDEMKQLREKHRSLSNYVLGMQKKMSRTSHTITCVGEDYIAYRDGDDEVFLPAHQIKSITRPLANEKNAE